MIGSLKDYYHFYHSRTMKRSTISSRGSHSFISMEPKVEWIQQQVVKRRIKRDFKPGAAQYPYFNDPKWPSMWYIHCNDDTHHCQSDMNIVGAWRRGYTGRNVVVTILDDGIERNHPDLQQNYDQMASFDVNGNDWDPMPRYDASNENKHGTRCAGEVAAVANNSHCTIGVAYNAKIGGVRMLDGDVTDMVEAKSLSLHPQHIDIYSASWGPDDDGKTVDGPASLARQAFENGIRMGRRGLGSIYVWASGNGGRSRDHCSCDGYTNSIYTISISSTAESGKKPWYLEECASTLATTYSSGESYDRKIITTDLRQRCTDSHTGTSASAPMAAGIIALALEANPNLSWRDVQHIIVRTSRSGHLNAPDWKTNAAGYRVSHLYGFGLMDAEAMVKEAERWKSVPPQHICVESPDKQSRTIRPEHVVRAVYKATGCSENLNHHVLYLEHIVVRVTIAHPRRGDLAIYLTSPSGTKSELLSNRLFDHSMEGFKSWEFMTTHSWGEKAVGDWVLEIHDSPSQLRNFKTPGKLKEFSLVLYGTSVHPYSSSYTPFDTPKVDRVRSSPVDEPSEGFQDEFTGSCDPECINGCDGLGPQHCIDCLHFFLKFKNNTRTCVPECPRGFYDDEKRRCKKCWSICENCVGSRSDQCISCKNGYHLNEETNVCVTNCPESFYLDKNGNTCRRCSENCRRCNGFQFCTDCKPGMSLQGTKCVFSCADGSYYNSQKRGCERCHFSCATCAGQGQESCTRCAPSFYMEDWRCVLSCSVGYFLDQPYENAEKTCRRCDPSCSTCIGHGERNCSTCPSGYNLEDGACVLGTVCKDGEYIDEKEKCQQCDFVCDKCSGPGEDKCISCVVTRLLDEGHCVLSCPIGKFQINVQCHRCHHTCRACTGGEHNNCLSCDKDKFGKDRYFYDGKCRESCPKSHYHADDKTCQRCSSNCEVCSSEAHCIKCSLGYFHTQNGCQQLDCRVGEVADPDYGDCVECAEGCDKCILVDLMSNLFYSFAHRCYTDCPAKTYNNDSTMTCISCHENCIDCDEEECFWCETGFFLKGKQKTECTHRCLDGFYGNEDTGVCEECHSSCSTCSGPSFNECTSCPIGEVLNNKQCLINNNTNKFFCSHLAETLRCELCHSFCKTCTGNKQNQCASCYAGLYLTVQQMCVTKCPRQTFASSKTGRCEQCGEACEICSESRENCERCLKMRDRSFFLHEGKCLSECPQGYYVSARKECERCDVSCRTCDQSPSNCQTCNPYYVLDNKQCKKKCSNKYYGTTEGICKRCPPDCEVCTDNNCTECNQHLYLHNGLCFEECPPGSFEDIDTSKCAPCNSKCAECNGPGFFNCEVCADHTSVIYDGECHETCPEGTYFNTTTDDCQECDKLCQSCVGASETECVECRTGLMRNNAGHCVMHWTCPLNMYMDITCKLCHKKCYQDRFLMKCVSFPFLLTVVPCYYTTCVNACPKSYFTVMNKHYCFACHKTCESCSGKYNTQCLTCKADWYRLGSVNYANMSTGICEKCHRSCKDCLGPAESNCATCQKDHFLLKSTHRCYKSCPDHYYEDNIEKTCERCHPTCNTCDGKGALQCTSCFGGFHLMGSICDSQCFAGHYLITEDPEILCEKCSAECLECKGPGKYNCTDCLPPLVMNLDGGNCLHCCKYVQSKLEDCCDCDVRFDPDGNATGKPTLFAIASVLLILGIGVGVFLLLKARSKGKLVIRAGYEKLPNQGKPTPFYNASKDNVTIRDSQVIDYKDRQPEVDDEDNEDEDIVYMGQDGTVYRKFKYGLLDEDDDDELEYDDESYSFK
uniref:Proprotein convertase subtilisin/kexin type 5b n=1 Tax=Callorhinchus milii TaxID=7868 RepID=A0A4W3IY08_CALMI